MPDWNKIVKARLQAAERSFNNSVVCELAAHLEEAFEAACARGATEVAALEQALQEVRSWRVLARDIERATAKEEFVNYRAKSLWLPALITLLGASASLAFFQYIGVRPYLLRVGPTALSLYWAWLASLPIPGALGAHLSRRAQGAATMRLAAGLAPALVMLTVMCLILPWGLAIDGMHFIHLVSFGIGLLNWVLIPAVALLVGAVPFLQTPTPDQITTAL
ncbi:MAG TPA: hypothetical protein VMG31_14015 [Verrucomicrobiae bacterium]|nr:hypothetical protein [Verrucomicrobiae bacterium]